MKKAHSPREIPLSRIRISQIKSTAEVWSSLSKETVPADRWLGRFFHHHRKKHGSRDRKFISETVYSLFRHRTYFEAWAKKFKAHDKTLFMVLTAAAYEKQLDENDFRHALLFFRLRNLPDSFFHDLCEKKTPYPLSGSWAEKAAFRHSFPLWLVQRWENHWGQSKTESLLRFCEERPPLILRANPLKTQREALIRLFTQKGIPCRPTPNSPYGVILEERFQVFEFEEFKKGLFEIQDEGSQIVCEIVDPRPGELVWDLCAGGGGKSLLMAAQMENKGRIIATDIRAYKLEDLKKRAKRAGAFNIFPADLHRLDEIHAARQGFDKILVDAPCSGTGTYRRNPDAKWKLSLPLLERHHLDQVQIVESALPRLKSEGILFYSTCSIDPAENEGTIAAVLKSHPELELTRLPNLEEGMHTLWPESGGCDGFFIAAMRKKKL